MSRSINRRRFLEVAASTGLAVGLAVQASAARNASDTLVVGVMGMGGRGTSLATGFQRLSGVEVAYVCDVDQARAGRAAEAVEKIEGKAPKAVGDFREILDDQAVDILVNATSNHWHAPAAILACTAGKHVYVEKPCSHNAREGELLVEAARKNKRQVQMGNQRRSWPRVVEAIEMVRRGLLGRTYYAQSWYNNNRPSIGRGSETSPPQGLDYDMWQGPAPRRPFRDNYLHYNWHWFWHWGNGELGNNGVHMIDVCRWGLGVDYPIHVASAGGRYRFDDDQETPDTHLVSFDFEDGKSIMWEGLSCNRMPQGKIADCIFHGEKGSLAIYGGGYAVYDPRGNEAKRESGPGGDVEHLENFIAAIREGTPLNSEIEEGHKSTLLCHLGNIAYRTGRSLKCDPKNGHIVDDSDATALWSREYEPGWEPKV
jgi:predicted dehydrogenase